MGRFNASLRLPGESQSLTAVVELKEGRLVLLSGDHLIGDWELTSVVLEPGPTGVKLNVEGETVLLDIENRSAFEEEAAQATGRKKKRGERRPKPAKKERKPVATAATARSQEPRPVPVPVEKVEGASGFDAFLGAAQARLGRFLPDWVFTKGGVLVVLAAIALIVFFADLVSTLLLIVGVIILLLAGVSMLDSVIAAKVLRHRMTPIQALIVGGTVFVTGLLIGMLG